MVLNQLKIGAILSYVVIGLNSLVGLLYTPYMLRMLGQSEYGLYSLSASVISYLTILDLGFGNAIIRYTAKSNAEGNIQHQYSMFGLFFSLYSAIGLVAFILGILLYYNVGNLFGQTMTSEELYKAGILILLMTFNLAITFPFSIFGSIISAYEKFVFQKILQIIRILLNTVVFILLLKVGYKAIGMVISTTVFNIFSLLLNYWYCKQKLKIRLHFRGFKWAFVKEVWIYSLYIFFNVIMDRIYWSSGQIILGITNGTKAVAVFSIGIQLQQFYMQFSTAITSVLLPKVTAMTMLKESEELISDLFIRIGRIQYCVMCFILISFILFGKQFIVLWAGANYIDAYTISLLFLIPLTVPLIQNLGIVILQARNQMKFRSFVYLIVAIGSLALQFFLAQKHGSVGCALGIAIALIIGQIVIMNFYYFKKQKINIPKFWREILKMTVSPALIGWGAYILLENYNLDTIPKFIIACVVFACVYLSVFWFIGMNNYERSLIKIPISSLMKRRQKS